MLTIAVSSRTLFHMEDGNGIFEKEGSDAFDAYMSEKEDVPLRPGVAFRLIRKLLALNTYENGRRDKVEVVLLSRNSPQAGLRVMKSIRHYGLDIERAIFSQGSDRFRYARAFGAHLFLSANAMDVQTAIGNGLAAATLVPRDAGEDSADMTVRIALDGDAVIFSAEADEKYQAEGLGAFQASEQANAHIPLGHGPFKVFLDTLQALQAQYPVEESPIRIGLFTARGVPAHERVLRTLRHWGIRLDEAAFCGGLPKGPLLQAFGADIFFDDTLKHVESACDHDVPAGHVPFGSGQGIIRDEDKKAA